MRENEITRQEAVRVLGLTRSGFNSVRHQLKKESRSKDGWLLFDRLEVEALAKSRSDTKRGGRPPKLKRSRDQNGDGEIYAGSSTTEHAYSAEDSGRVFRCLDKNISLVAISLECKMHPRLVRLIASDYADLKESIILSSAVMREIEKLPLEGNMPFKNERDLLDAIKAAVTPCSSCGKQERAVCKQCATKPPLVVKPAIVNGTVDRRRTA